MIFTPSTATEVHEPPAWAIAYLNKLRAVVAYEKEIKLYAATPDVFEGKTIGITHNPVAYTVTTDPPIIVMLETLTDCDRSRNALCHEFVHVLHADVDRVCIRALNDGDLEEYAHRMEDFVSVIFKIMRIVDHVTVTWVD
jgi:hypothetical protein